MKRIVLLSLMALILSCNASKVSYESSKGQAPVLVYKTKADYSHLVPVILNEAGDMIVSYPAPSDLYLDGVLAKPVQLENGYLLDQRGIRTNTAFTSYTYEAYSQLESAPLIKDLLASIIDPDPFVEFYDCGKRGQYKSLEAKLNKLIRRNFKGCKRLDTGNQK